MDAPDRFELSPRERMRGCLLGGAVGDSLGAGVEFTDLDEIRRVQGPDGVTELTPAYGGIGLITDDTQMTLFTAEGLIRAANRHRDRGLVHTPTVVHRAYLRWLHTQSASLGAASPGSSDEYLLTGWLITHPQLFARRAPGNTCLSALVSQEPRGIEAPHRRHETPMDRQSERIAGGPWKPRRSERRSGRHS